MKTFQTGCFSELVGVLKVGSKHWMSVKFLLSGYLAEYVSTSSISVSTMLFHL